MNASMRDNSLSGRTICIVDDDAIFSELMTLKMQDCGVSVVAASSGPQLFDIMKQTRLDCILMDYTLSHENGFILYDQLCRRFIDAPPVIMLTATDNQRTIIKAFRTGFDDYVIKKGLRFEEVHFAVRAAIARRAGGDTLKSELRRLKSQAAVDEMTGLYRNDAVTAMLARLVEVADLNDKRFAVILIHADQLDTLESKVGQVFAKRAFAAFAAELRKSVRGTDICGRGEGTSFVYIVDKAATRKDAEMLVERLRQVLTFELRLESLTINVAADFGIALFPEDGVTPAGLLAFARRTVAKAPLQAVSEPAEDVTDMSPLAAGDRRRAVRRRLFKGAKIIIDTGRTVLDCTIHDISTVGAQLKLAADFTVPEEFGLRLEGSGPTLLARRVWRRGNHVGVEFRG